MLREIHGRACRVFQEISCLIHNDFADAAFARWRTLFELSIFAQFIKEDTEDVAKSYYDSIENDQGDNSWIKKSKRISPKQKRVTFNKIFELVAKQNKNDAIWKRHYQLSNMTVHAGPSGTFMSFALSRSPQAILVGPSDYGLHLAAELTILSLSRITTFWFCIFPDAKTSIDLSIVQRFIPFFRVKLYETASKIFPDDQDLQNAYRKAIEIRKNLIRQTDNDNFQDLR